MGRRGTPPSRGYSATKEMRMECLDASADPNHDQMTATRARIHTPWEGMLESDVGQSSEGG